jgi:hypothetical protein
MLRGTGFRLLIAADESAIEEAAELRSGGAEVEAVQADLATEASVDKPYAAAEGRPVARFSPTPESGLVARFSIRTARRRACDRTNIVGTAYLIHKIGSSLSLRENVICTPVATLPFPS